MQFFCNVSCSKKKRITNLRDRHVLDDDDESCLVVEGWVSLLLECTGQEGRGPLRSAGLLDSVKLENEPSCDSNNYTIDVTFFLFHFH